jgi:hypothetical protein
MNEAYELLKLIFLSIEMIPNDARLYSFSRWINRMVQAL